MSLHRVDGQTGANSKRHEWPQVHMQRETWAFCKYAKNILKDLLVHHHQSNAAGKRRAWIPRHMFCSAEMRWETSERQVVTHWHPDRPEGGVTWSVIAGLRVVKLSYLCTLDCSWRGWGVVLSLFLKSTKKRRALRVHTFYTTTPNTNSILRPNTVLQTLVMSPTQLLLFLKGIGIVFNQKYIVIEMCCSSKRIRIRGTK